MLKLLILTLKDYISIEFMYIDGFDVPTEFCSCRNFSEKWQQPFLVPDHCVIGWKEKNQIVYFFSSTPSSIKIMFVLVGTAI